MPDRTILVTGADGFIGSHLTEQLICAGENVKALVQYNSFNRWGWLDSINRIDEKAEIISGDIRDSAFCQKLCKGVDVVYHLASLIAIPYSYQAPSSYVETNINGSLNICQAALDQGVDRLIHTSTSEVYGTAQYVPMDEKHPLQPQSPYSATKIAADAIAYSYYSAFGLPITIARPFNTYGPRQSARAVIPSVILQLLRGEDIKTGDVSPMRDFNYVSDTCRGFRLLAGSEEAIGEIVNIGSDTEISIADTIALISGILGKSANITVEDQRIRPEKSEVFHLRCDNTKIFKMTGFEPQFSFKQGLEKTIEWFSCKENSLYYKPDLYNV